MSVDGRCTGCGVCAKVCPVGNIELVDGKPAWRRRCELCLACDEWCQRRAIRHWAKTPGKDYRHPKVSLDDMLAQAGSRDWQFLPTALPFPRNAIY